jgi:hypothetical protein
MQPYKKEEQEVAYSFKKKQEKKRKKSCIKKREKKRRYQIAESLLLHYTVLRGLVPHLCTRSLSNVVPGPLELLLASLLCIATRAFTLTYTIFELTFQS